jgi:hypothetical protein
MRETNPLVISTKPSALRKQDLFPVQFAAIITAEDAESLLIPDLFADSRNQPLN